MGSYKYVDGNGVLQDIINDFAISTDTGNKVTRGSDGGLFVANENSNFADAWNSTTLYTVGKLVIHNDILWKCLVQNTGEEPASGSTYWEQTSLDEIASGLNNSIVDLEEYSNEVVIGQYNGYKVKRVCNKASYVNASGDTTLKALTDIQFMIRTYGSFSFDGATQNLLPLPYTDNGSSVSVVRLIVSNNNFKAINNTSYKIVNVIGFIEYVSTERA